MRSIYFGVILGLVFTFFVVTPARAAGLTVAQAQAIIALLQAFDAEASVIANVQHNLGISTSQVINEHRLGSPNATVVLTLYCSFESVYCTKIFPTLKKILDEFGNQVAVVYRHMPLRQIFSQAEPAANAAECIAEQLGNDNFWIFAESILTHQDELSANYYTQEATRMGADTAKFTLCAAERKYQKVIDVDVAEAERQNVQGTPSIIMRNVYTGKREKIDGALPHETIVVWVEKMLSQ